MLSKSNRLSKLQFDEVFKKGRVFHSPIFVIRVLVGTTDTRFSAVMPNKIEKTAAGRNYSRRKTYIALRNISPLIKKSCNVILIAKKSVKNIEATELQNDIKGVFVKSTILE